MIRFIAFLLGKQYEPCKSCETLQRQLDMVNAEKKDLLGMIFNTIKPNIITAPTEPVIFNPLPNKTSWAARRAVLEREDRAIAQARAAQEKAIALEKELLGDKEDSVGSGVA